MPKRSLNSGKNEPIKLEPAKIEQLNRALDGLLARSDGRLPQVEASVAPLVRMARRICATCRGKNSRHDLNLNYWKGKKL